MNYRMQRDLLAEIQRLYLHFGLIYQACGGDLDGDTAEAWALHAVDPADYALRAARELAQDYDEALTEIIEPKS